MSTLCRAGVLLRSFYPVSNGFSCKTSLCKNALIVRACSGGSGSVLQRIEKKQDEAVVGGGQRRIDAQHRKVRSENLKLRVLSIF